MKHIEHAHQAALVQWAKKAAAHYPELVMLYAIPNGGGRSKAEAGRLKAEGVRAGMPDLCLPVPRKQFGACYIEVKRPASPGISKGTVTKEQRDMAEALSAHGNLVATAYGWDQAKDVLIEYLSL